MQYIKKSEQNRLSQLVNHPVFANTVIGLIIFNAVLVGMETYSDLYLAYIEWFYIADRILLWLFTIEIVLRMIARRPYLHFFKEGWNVFDFIIVVSGHLFVGAHFITVLRVLRILRVLRVFSVIPSLRKMVNALIMTIPAMGNIAFLLGIFFYIYAVIGTFLFANVIPEYFGSLHSTMFTLFQVVTLESWASGVARPIIELVPWSWVYFVTFILIGTFVIFNLFVGVIVSNIEQANADDDKKQKELSQDQAAEQDRHAEAMQANRETATEKELAALREEIQELKKLLLASQQK